MSNLFNTNELKEIGSKITLLLEPYNRIERHAILEIVKLFNIDVDCED